MGNDLKHSCGAIRLHIGVADEVVAVQKWQSVVTSRTLVWRHIDLPSVVEVPQPIRQTAIINDWIERREQQWFACGLCCACRMLEHPNITAQNMQAGNRSVFHNNGDNVICDGSVFRGFEDR